MEWKRFTFVLLVAFISVARGEEYADYWNEQAQNSIDEALALQALNIGEAKNIIFFLGDGMSVTTITAARIRQGQLRGETGEENSLTWDTFPYAGLIKTYNTDDQTPDSAGTATAFFTGVKTKAGVLGIDDHVMRGDCASGQGYEVDSVLVEAHNTGKATGLVSTARVTHATPGALYAHSADRNWEANSDMPSTEEACKDIALQLVEDHPYIKVIMGGGRRNFYNVTETDPEDASDKGDRTDGRNLINEWLQDKPNSHYVWNKDQFDAINIQNTDYLLGLFADSHMNYASETEAGNEPTLASMTETAIKMLQKESKGFFLAIEGGRVDHAHHAGRAFDALGDAIALSDAVAMAMSLTDQSDTLIVVTADHSHTMAFAGYPKRGNPILGLSGDTGADGLPYTTLGYLNGPGGFIVEDSYIETGYRPNLTETDTEDPDFVQDAIVPLSSETHGGEDVAIFALGPMAHLFHGVQEQNYIAHVMRFAGCYDDDQKNVCNTDVAPTQNSGGPGSTEDPCGGASTIQSRTTLFLALGLYILFAFL